MSSLRVALLSALLLIIVLAGVEPAAAQDRPAAMVKVTTPMKIDGDPAEWADITARQTVQGRLGTAATFALAYDDANCYAFIRVTDASPLQNGATVFQELLKGGDALSLCFGALNGHGAAQRIMLASIRGGTEIVAMRPQWPDKRHPYAYFTAAAGRVPMDMVWHLAPDGAKVAFTPTKTGYDAEVSLPWAALGIHPTAGAEFPFDLQVIYSDPAGATNVDTSWWHARGGGPSCTTDTATEARLYPDTWGTVHLYATDPGPQPEDTAHEVDPAFQPRGLPIHFSLPRAAKVSAVVKNARGFIVRELLRAKPLPAGAHTIYWDGRDRWNSLLPPGSYSYLIGYFDGLVTHFAASAGNSARPPYRTADGLGSIGGQHYGPVAVAADAGGIYMLTAGEEGQPCLRKIDPATMQSRWFHSTGIFGGGQAVAADDRYAYMISSVNNTTTFTRLDPATGRDVPIGAQQAPLPLGNITASGLAITGGKAYFTVPAENRIGVIDLATGAQGKDLPLPAPVNLCARDADTLLVCTAQEVDTLRPATGERTPLITGLTAPSAVTVDPAGNIYLADLGASQQVKKYSAAGKLLATFGVAGGRGYTAVPYNPLAFRNITGLTYGPDGNLWLIEAGVPPRRYIRLTPDGKWLEDICGPTHCGAVVGFDLDDPTSLYFTDGCGVAQFINARVDYAAYARAHDPSKGFSIAGIWCMSQNGSDYSASPDLMAGKNGAMTLDYNRVMIFTGQNGKRYLWSPGGGRTGLFLWEDGKWKAAATVGGNDAIKYWSDANGDGLVQPAECTDATPPTGSWGWIGRDLTLYGIDGTLKPAAIDARGVPTYVGGAFTPYVATGTPLQHFFTDPAYWPCVAPGTSDGSIYFTENNGPHQNHDFWDRCTENRLIKVKDGKVVWTVGAHDGTLAHDGDGIVYFGVAGETDGVVVVADVGSQFVGYTSDGLALGWLLTDAPGHRSDVGPNSIYVENASPNLFIKDAKSGKHLLISHTTEDVRVLEVTGGFGADVTRLTGALTLATSLPRHDGAQPGVTALPYSTWNKSIYEHWRGTNIDGFAYEWAPEVPSVNLYDGAILRGEVRLRRDAGNLCVYTEVLDTATFPATPGAATPSALFGKAPGLELLLGPLEPGTRTGPASGDTRLFLTATRATNGDLTGLVLACRPASAPVAASPELSPLDATGRYRDGGTTAPLDCHAALTPAPGVMIKVRERLDGAGYALKAEIPLALFPELSRRTDITFWHGSTKTDDGEAYHETRADLRIPLRLNAAIWRTGAGGVTRLPWSADGFTGVDPTTMAPARWGVVTDPPSLALTVFSAGAAQPALSYVTTAVSSYTFGDGPVVTVPRCLFGGGWFEENGAQTFLTTPARAGFRIDAPAGGGAPVNGDWRTAKLHMDAVGIANRNSRGQRTRSRTTPLATVVTLGLQPGQAGKLHVLWGSYTDNSPAGATLTITDLLSGKTLNTASYPDLRYATDFNRNFETRETVVMVCGAQTLTVAIADTAGDSRAYLQGIWLETLDQTAITLPTTLTLAAYPGAALAPVRAVAFFVDGAKIGEATHAPYTLRWTPTRPGVYTLTARLTDALGAAGVADPLRVTVKSAAGL